MAALAPSAQQLLLLAETGDTPDGQLRGLVGAWFAGEGVTTSAGAVQLLAVKQKMYAFLISYYRDAMSRVLTEDERETLKLRLQTLENQAAETAERATLLLSNQAAGVAVVGRLTTVAPVDAPRWGPDANDRAFGGDPYRRSGWR